MRRRAIGLVACGAAVGLAVPTGADAATLYGPKSMAECYFADFTFTKASMRFGIDAELGQYYPNWDALPVSTQFVYETTINLREQYGQKYTYHGGYRWRKLKWKSYPTKIARSAVFESDEYGNIDNAWELAYANGIGAFSTRSYSRKAWRRFHRAKGNASVVLKNAQTGAVYAQAGPLRFTWLSDTGCTVRVVTGAPLING